MNLLSIVGITTLFGIMWVFIGYSAGREQGYEDATKQHNKKLQECHRIIYEN